MDAGKKAIAMLRWASIPERAYRRVRGRHRDIRHIVDEDLRTRAARARLPLGE
jgi:hypothetical protein